MKNTQNNNWNIMTISSPLFAHAYEGDLVLI